jgi:hypothetical protein
LQEYSAGRCQARTSAISIKEHNPQFVFQLFDRSRQWRLLDM